MKTRKLPKTDSIDELAKFWDSHDLMYFKEEMEEVNGPVFVRDAPIQVHFHSNEAKAVEKIAQSKGVSREQLIRQWVLQKLARRKGRGVING